MALQNASCLASQCADAVTVKLANDLKLENYGLSKGKKMWLFISYNLYAKILLAPRN